MNFAMRASLSSMLLAALALGCGDTGPKPPAQSPAAASTGSTAAPVSKAAAASKAAVVSKLAKTPAMTGKSDIPALASALSATHTGGFLAAERPHELIAQLDRVVAGLPADAKVDMPPPIKDPAARTAMLGFDATTAAGWESAGLDPSGGAGMVFDTRVSDPIFVIKVRDQKAALATLNRLGAKASLGASADGVTELTINGDTGLMGTRAGYTFLLGPKKAKTERAAFIEVLKSDAPLAQDATLKRTFSDGVGNLWLSGYANGAAIARLIKTKEPGAAALVDFYSERFEAFAFVAGQSGGTARLLAGAKGVKALQQLFVPAGKAPDFARRITQDRAAFRFDINFAEFFDGVLALIPEQMAKPRSMVLMGKNALPMAIGASFDQLAAALSGHMAISVQAVVQRRGPPLPVVMLGVKDGAKTDALLKTVTDMLSNVHKAPITAGKVGGRDGYLIDGPMKIGAVRIDSMLFVGPLAEVEAAIVAKGDLPASVVQQVNGPAVFGLYVGFEQLLDGMGAQMQPEDLKTMKALAKNTWEGMLTDGYLSSRWTVDGRGLKLGEGPAMMAIVGILAAVAVPAFVKYVRTAKTSEATLNLRKIFDSSVAFAEAEHASIDGTIKPPHFPKSAPLTPATTACKDGKPVKHVPTPEMWNHPTWQALNFEIVDPFYYQYQYVSDGKSFTARVVGDLDCDGVLSTFERVGSFNAKGNVVGGAGMYKERPLE